MTKLTNSAPARGGQPYESPALEIIDINTESVLCASPFGNSIDDAEELDWGTL